MLEKSSRTSIKRNCNYKFPTFGSDDKYNGSLAFFRFFSSAFLFFPLLPIVKILYPWLCQCGVLKHFEVIIIYQSILHKDDLKPGLILMVVFTFQVVVFQRDNDGSTYNYMKIL